MPGEYIIHWPHLSETRVTSQVARLKIFLSPLPNTVFVSIILEPIQPGGKPMIRVKMIIKESVEKIEEKVTARCSSQ